MKTEVTMVRFLDEFEIKQKSKTGYFCLTDMLKVINKKRIQNTLSATHLGNYFNATPTKEFLRELSKQKNIPVNMLVVSNKKHGTWAHPYVLIDFALWGYPELKVRVYDWMYDNLLKFRNDSGNSFKEMNMVLDTIFGIGGKYWVYADVANMIAKQVRLKNVKNKWQFASEKQLDDRNKLQQEIISSAYAAKSFGENDVYKCIKTAIKIFRLKTKNIREFDNNS